MAGRCSPVKLLKNTSRTDGPAKCLYGRVLRLRETDTLSEFLRMTMIPALGDRSELHQFAVKAVR